MKQTLIIRVLLVSPMSSKHEKYVSWSNICFDASVTTLDERGSSLGSKSPDPGTEPLLFKCWLNINP